MCKIVLKPVVIPQFGSFEAVYQVKNGRIRSAWKVEEDSVYMEVEIPEGNSAVVTLPDGQKRELPGGRYTFCSIRLPYNP